MTEGSEAAAFLIADATVPIGGAIAASTSADNGHSRPTRASPTYGLRVESPSAPSTRAATLVIVAASSSNPPCDVERVGESTAPVFVTDQIARAAGPENNVRN